MSAPWEEWIGRTDVREDTATLTPARALAATLDHDGQDLEIGDPIPGLWIWLYFIPLARMSAIGPDGHPKRGGFLPPIEAPRRMWAGSRCTFHAPVRIGAALKRTSVISAISEKEGRSGKLTFVSVRHRVLADGAPAFEEEQDLVFTPIPGRYEPPEPVAPPSETWRERVAVDPVLLFRFSALTFNSHRIHYDRDYATGIEKYPGLVVHGPLQAMLMFNAAVRRNPGRRAASFAFRAVRPLFDFEEVHVGGATADDGALDVFVSNAENAMTARATVTFAPDGA